MFLIITLKEVEIFKEINGRAKLLPGTDVEVFVKYIIIDL